MRSLMFALPLMTLTACGSNVPQNDQSAEAPGMAHPSMPMTGNQDRDFATMMVAHHQGAIQMARQQLVRGRDPELKALAAKMIQDQDREITQLQAWLGRNR